MGNANDFMNPIGDKRITEHFQLKPDHVQRPIWLTHDGTIFLEAFSPLCKEVTEFLIAIAEPMSRPNHIHEYKLTSTSLYAAASVEFTKDFIIKILNNFCKNLYVPKQVEEDIERYTSRYGKAKLIL
jgi:DNA excision repair protein ERCC-3